MVEWIQQTDKSIMDHRMGSTILVKYCNSFEGITADDGSVIDISWTRYNDLIYTTGGTYRVEDIKAWAII